MIVINIINMQGKLNVDTNSRNSHFSTWIFQHLESPNNKADTYFDFTEENYERANRILKKYPDNYRQAAMIPLLDLAQRQSGG